MEWNGTRMTQMKRIFTEIYWFTIKNDFLFDTA